MKAMLVSEPLDIWYSVITTQHKEEHNNESNQSQCWQGECL